MRTFVIGDIHGAFKALVQCLQRSGFDYVRDRLIVLGDVCDRKPQTRECIEELLKMSHVELVIGNHDLYFLEWIHTGDQDPLWEQQGGRATTISYAEGVPPAHTQFLESAHPWFIIDEKLFVHGGFDWREALNEQPLETIVWDRTLIQTAVSLHPTNPEFRFGPYGEIFLGHTPTTKFGAMEPMKRCNVWAVDTGAGWSGRLTIMDVESKAYWQSDLVTELYP